MRGHIEQRYGSKSIYTIIIEAGRNPETGKRRRIVRNFAGPKREAEKEMIRIISELEKGTYVEPADKTLGEWLNEWFDTRKKSLSPKTQKRYAECIKRIIKKLGQVQLDKLRPYHIQQFYNELSDPPNNEKSLAPATVHYHHAVLHGALKSAVNLQIIPSNPATGLILPKRRKSQVKPLTSEEINDLLEDAKQTPYYIPVLLAITCGLRRGEVCGLRWQDVDLERGTLTVNQVLGYTPERGLYFKEPKTEESRKTIAMPEITIEALKQYRIEQNKRRLKVGAQWTDLDLICDRGDGRPRHPDTITHWLPKWLKSRGMGKETFHGLRHAHASWLIDLDVNPKVIQERMRHKDISTTMMIYGHLMPGRDRQAANKIQAAIEKEKKPKRATKK